MEGEINRPTIVIFSFGAKGHFFKGVIWVALQRDVEDSSNLK